MRGWAPGRRLRWPCKKVQHRQNPSSSPTILYARVLRPPPNTPQNPRAQSITDSNASTQQQLPNFTLLKTSTCAAGEQFNRCRLLSKTVISRELHLQEKQFFILDVNHLASSTLSDDSVPQDSDKALQYFIQHQLTGPDRTRLDQSLKLLQWKFRSDIRNYFSVRVIVEGHRYPKCGGVTIPAGVPEPRRCGQCAWWGWLGDLQRFFPTITIL